MYSYFKQVLSLDPDGVWLDLCRNHDLAKDRCRAFLRAYVKYSFQQVPILGPEEYEEKQTVTSANTLLNVWRCLIAQADATVLLDQRRKDPSNKDTWRLKFLDHTNRKGHGPVFEISKVGLLYFLLPLSPLPFRQSPTCPHANMTPVRHHVRGLASSPLTSNSGLPGSRLSFSDLWACSGFFQRGRLNSGLLPS